MRRHRSKEIVGKRGSAAKGERCSSGEAWADEQADKHDAGHKEVAETGARIACFLEPDH